MLARVDLGQVEPWVLAAVSGDDAFAAATADPDLYAPVARRLGCERSRAKVAVLAAMYGQTSGAASAALAGLDGPVRPQRRRPGSGRGAVHNVAVSVRAAPPDGAPVVLCLHGELLVHTPREHAPTVTDLLHATLASTGTRWATGSGVRFVADVSVVARWSDAKD